MEHKRAVDIIAFFIVPFFNAESCKKWGKMTPSLQNASKKIEFSTLMTKFRFMFL